MAGNNQNESAKPAEATRANVRQAADQTQEALRTGVEGVRRMTEEFSKTFGFTGQNEEVARQATRNMEAITQTGSILVQGFQEVSREWLRFAQQRAQSNAEAITKLASCRTLPDLAAAQTEIIRDNLRQMIDSTRKLSEHSMQVAEEASKTIAAETTRAAERFRRAA